MVLGALVMDPVHVVYMSTSPVLNISQDIADVETCLQNTLVQLSKVRMQEDMQQ